MKATAADAAKAGSADAAKAGSVATAAKAGSVATAGKAAGSVAKAIKAQAGAVVAKANKAGAVVAKAEPKAGAVVAKAKVIEPKAGGGEGQGHRAEGWGQGDPAADAEGQQEEASAPVIGQSGGKKGGVRVGAFSLPLRLWSCTLLHHDFAQAGPPDHSGSVRAPRHSRLLPCWFDGGVPDMSSDLTG